MKTFLCLVACLCCCTAICSAAPIYYENFPAPSGTGSYDLGPYGYSASYSTSTANLSSASKGNGSPNPSAQISGGGTAGSTSPNIGANTPSMTAVTNGVAVVVSYDPTAQFLLSTNAPTTLNQSDVSQFTWVSASGLSGDTVRLAIYVGQWYVSSTAIAVASGFTGASSFNTMTPTTETVTFSTDSQTWLKLQDSSGKPLSVDSTPMSLPAGQITAFGVYADFSQNAANTSQDKIFVDNFEIDPAPEPFQLEIALPALMLLRRRS